MFNQVRLSLLLGTTLSTWQCFLLRTSHVLIWQCFETTDTHHRRRRQPPSVLSVACTAYRSQTLLSETFVTKIIFSCFYVSCLFFPSNSSSVRFKCVSIAIFNKTQGWKTIILYQNGQSTVLWSRCLDLDSFLDSQPLLQINVLLRRSEESCCQILGTSCFFFNLSCGASLFTVSLTGSGHIQIYVSFLAC